MTVGTWKPATKRGAADIRQEILRGFAQLSHTEQLAELGSVVPPDQQREQSFLMRLEEADWQGVLDDWSEADLIHLVRFFTCAEMQLPGWEGGEKSPVIWLVRQLKKRRLPPSRELCTWIKKHSRNRFLPHGSL